MHTGLHDQTANVSLKIYASTYVRLGMAAITCSPNFYSAVTSAHFDGNTLFRVHKPVR